MSKDSTSVLRRLRVTLPNGEMADMVLYPGYEVEDIVDVFLLQHGMDEDILARKRLVQSALALQMKPPPSPNGRSAGNGAQPVSNQLVSANQQSLKERAHPIRVRLQLPSGVMVESIIKNNEDAALASVRLAQQYQLNEVDEMRVYEHLRTTLK